MRSSHASELSNRNAPEPLIRACVHGLYVLASAVVGVRGVLLVACDDEDVGVCLWWLALVGVEVCGRDGWMLKGPPEVKCEPGQGTICSI